MPNIKQIITPDNTAYDIKDSAAVSNIVYNTTNSPALQKTINDTTTTIEIPDTTPTSGSKHLITSGAVYSTVGDINTILENIIDGTTLIEKSIAANGTYSAEDDEADGYSSVTVAVPNTYSVSDEGKVVSNGALVSQSSDTVTENGTVDTTLISSLLVNVPSNSDPEAYHPSYQGIILSSTCGVYFGGSPASTSKASQVFTLSLPETFPVEKIGSTIFGYCKRGSTNVSIQCEYNATNRVIQTSIPSTTTTYTGLYYMIMFSINKTD